MTIFALFSFLQFRNITGAYFKYVQNNISEINISSTAERSTTSYSFAWILYTFSMCDVPLHLE